MEYKRANYSHNFLNAVETDHRAAWNMFVNELNELLVNHTAAVIDAVRASGLRIHDNSPLKEISDLIHDKIRDTPQLRPRLTKLIMARHKDQLISAEGGQFDTVYSGAAGDAAKGTNDQDPAQVEALNEATEKLVGAVPNQNNLSLDKEEATKIGTENLDSKLKYLDMPGKKIFTRDVNIGLAVVAGGLLLWGLYRILKR